MVLQASGEGRIKRSAAETFLSAIKLAIRLITEMAEAGETLSPADFTLRSQPLRNFDRSQPTRKDDKLAAALAAAAKQPNPFTAARPSSALQSDIDPATARMVKEMLAQSRDFPRIERSRA